ncbi:MAG: M23 family metallopeptidase [Acaryochloris sp. RU_4_1]|nr:M23 family metallopeptidase [Acaryochloris sp. RU_4_1]NJR55489.1 M23 family metallopeptidase [Acaryochloris sp. CRU_2_0]
MTATGGQPLGKLTRGKGEPGKTYPEYTNAVPGVPINSPYGMRWGKPHNGTDQAAPRGTSVLATNGGKVIKVVTGCTEGDQNCGGGWGNYVVIQHSDGVQSLYAHLQTVNVTEGMDVGRGDGIAGIGSTGHSTGPHLHYEHAINTQVGVPLSGQVVNPEYHVHR